MFFTTLVLVSVDGEHDRLKQRINLGHGDETAEMRDMSGLGLEQEKQIPVLLCLLVVWKEPFLQFGGVVEVVRNFVLLHVALE